MNAVASRLDLLVHSTVSPGIQFSRRHLQWLPLPGTCCIVAWMGSLNGRFTYLLVAGGGLHLHNPRAGGNSILPQRDWTRQMHDVVSHCVQDQLDYGVESEFLHYVISVGFCGLHGYPQDCCHVLGSAALPDHLDDLSLAWRQSRLHCSSFIVLPLTQAAV